MKPAHASHSLRFKHFYRQVFLPEHRRPLNVFMHIVGTLLGLAFVAAIVTGAVTWWLAPLFPVVHAVPGLIGHRLFERNAAVGDVRITRKDYPPLWFIAGNHLMCWDLVTKGFYWRNVRAAPEQASR
jgi:hypothetical protein